MSGQYVLDGHTPVPADDLLTWGRWLEDSGEQRRVGNDHPTPGVRVSTVFLGLDHSFGSGPPLLFETTVFGGPLDGTQERYSTWDEAEAGHAATLARASEAK